jgi:uncharacterized protein (TIGR04222 family)
MIHEIFDFFPFNMASGPAFLAFYFFFALAAFVGAIYLRRAVGARIDRAIVTSTRSSAPIAGTNADPYRAQGVVAPTDRKRLTVGWIPGVDEHWAIAYLKGGERNVANTMISVAMASGWLSTEKEKPGFAHFRGANLPDDPGLLAFHKRLASYQASTLTLFDVRLAAGTATTDMRPEIIRDLDATGMERSPATVRTLTWIVWLSGAFTVGVGMIRFVRAVELNRPAGFLIIQMLLFAFAFWILAFTTSTKSTLHREYLRWLDDSTISLRTAVRNGRRSDPTDVGLAVAVGGASVLAAHTSFVAIHRALVPEPVAVASGGSSGSSSDSSSSSFGGGSSCSSGGGSSCGGGGGGGGGGCGG